MNRRIGEAEDDLIIGAVLIGGAYLLLNGFLSNAGGNDPNVTAQASVAPGQNPFSYQFQPFIDFYNNNTPTIIATQATNIFPFGSTAQTQLTNPTIQQFFQAIYNSPPATSPWGYLDVVNLSARAQQLYNALNVSALNPFSTSDQTSALSAVAGLSNQLQMAFIANYFWWNYNQDLLTWLQGSWFKSGFTAGNIDALINTVNSLPVNPS